MGYLCHCCCDTDVNQYNNGRLSHHWLKPLLNMTGKDISLLHVWLINNSFTFSELSSAFLLCLCFFLSNVWQTVAHWHVSFVWVAASLPMIPSPLHKKMTITFLHSCSQHCLDFIATLKYFEMKIENDLWMTLTHTRMMPGLNINRSVVVFISLASNHRAGIRGPSA